VAEPTLAEAHAALREWSRSAKELPSHDGHILIRYFSIGALTGEMRPVWRCSCDPRNQYAIYVEDEWRFGAACKPEEHIAQRIRPEEERK
jgi:hypothetical protein